ncbi:MAG: hypothetical protein CL816_03435 [Coxiellaceae bacterium]|nr:hypothetical protein [Coxiellaceae bacterium]|tara:strand:+ start:2166 stop:2714 length:549 start_codon:yes stop_codon:yes gene_type:complete
MVSINRVHVTGRLGAKPTAETSLNGKPYAKFSVAQDDNYKRNGEWVTNTNWFKVEVYGDSARSVLERLDKGDYVYVEGKFTSDVNKNTRVTFWKVMASYWYKTPDQRKSHQGQDLNQAQINDQWVSQDQQIQRVTNTSNPYADQQPAPQSAWDKGADNTWPQQDQSQWASPQPRAIHGNIIK